MVVSSRKQGSVDATVAALRERGVTCTGVVCHVSNAAHRQRLIDTAIQVCTSCCLLPSPPSAMSATLHTGSGSLTPQSRCAPPVASHRPCQQRCTPATAHRHRNSGLLQRRRGISTGLAVRVCCSPCVLQRGRGTNSKAVPLPLTAASICLVSNAAAVHRHCNPCMLQKEARHEGSVFVQAFGRLDVLVNNAVVNPTMGPLAETPSAAISKILDTNIKAGLELTQAAVPLMRRGAAVLFVTSITAYNPAPPLAMYAVSKTALLGLVKALGTELGAQGIRVNGIAPGFVPTKFSQALVESPGLREHQVCFSLPFCGFLSHRLPEHQVNSGSV